MNAETMPAHYSKLPRNRVFTVGPNTVQSMITGVYCAQQDKTGRVILTYTDGKTESALCPEINLGDAECEAFNFFAVVSAVQSKRIKPK